MYSLAENFFGLMTSRLGLLFFIAGWFPLIDQCTQPKIIDIKMRERIIRDIWSVLIYITWGMNVLHFLWVAVVSLWLHSIHAFLVVFPVYFLVYFHFKSLIQKSHQCTVNIIFLRHCGKEILRKTLPLSTTRYHRPAFW